VLCLHESKMSHSLALHYLPKVSEPVTFFLLQTLTLLFFLLWLCGES
jgi:hypothetical protein